MSLAEISSHAVEKLGSPSSDLSMFHLFMSADIVVKIVMGILLFYSLWSWSIIFDKHFKLGRLHRLASRFENQFWSAGSLDQLYEKIGRRIKDPMVGLFVAGMKEWNMAMDKASETGSTLHASVQQRIDRVMSVAIRREMSRLEKSMTFLATVGSTAPFIGLFGTVWGIMNSFTAIANTQNTNLATVAPGIAEALFATALGLVAAVPAVVAYNKFSHQLSQYGERLETFAGEFGTILSRHMQANKKM